MDMKGWDGALIDVVSGHLSSATEENHFSRCSIGGSHSDDYEELYLTQRRGDPAKANRRCGGTSAVFSLHQRDNQNIATWRLPYAGLHVCVSETTVLFSQFTDHLAIRRYTV
jgi:hypothetical protein